MTIPLSLSWFQSYAFHVLELDTPIMESIMAYHRHFAHQVTHWSVRMHEFPWDQCTDYALLLTLIRSRGEYIHSVPQEYRTLELCLAALETCFWAHTAVPNPLRTREVYETMMRVYPHGIIYVPEQYRTRDRWLSAVQRQGNLLYRVSTMAPALLHDTELCLAAVQTAGTPLQWVPATAQTLQICVAAVAQDTTAIRYVCDVASRPHIRAAAREIRMSRAHPEPAQLQAARAAHAYHMQLRAARDVRRHRVSCT